MAKPRDPAILHARVIYYSVMMQGQAGASVDMICSSLADWLRRFHPQDLPADEQALRSLVEPRLRDLLRAGRLNAHPEHPLVNGVIVHYQGVFKRRIAEVTSLALHSEQLMSRSPHPGHP